LLKLHYWIKNHEDPAAKQESFIFAIKGKIDGKMIETVTFRLENSHKRAELAYWFDVPFLGKGYASEALKRQLNSGLMI
jgi:RimJ/RimL family protein N-acetyltransferase